MSSGNFRQNGEHRYSTPGTCYANNEVTNKTSKRRKSKRVSKSEQNTETTEKTELPIKETSQINHRSGQNKKSKYIKNENRRVHSEILTVERASENQPGLSPVAESPRRSSRNRKSRKNKKSTKAVNVQKIHEEIKTLTADSIAVLPDEKPEIMISSEHAVAPGNDAEHSALPDKKQFEATPCNSGEKHEKYGDSCSTNVKNVAQDEALTPRTDSAHLDRCPYDTEPNTTCDYDMLGIPLSERQLPVTCQTESEQLEDKLNITGASGSVHQSCATAKQGTLKRTLGLFGISEKVSEKRTQHPRSKQTDESENVKTERITKNLSKMERLIASITSAFKRSSIDTGTESRKSLTEIMFKRRKSSERNRQIALSAKCENTCAD